MRSVLIVEDESTLKDSLAVLFETEDYRVQTASNGHAALELLHAGTSLPAAIIVDLMMPVMDGFAFLRAVEAEPAWRDIKIVVLTALEHPAVNAAAVLKKPVNFDRILQVVGELLSSGATI